MYAKDIQDNDDPEGLPECVDDSVQQTVANLVSSTWVATTSKMALAFVAIFLVTRTHFRLHNLFCACKTTRMRDRNNIYDEDN